MRDAEFERLYAEHAQGLFGFLTYRTGDRVLAEDLVADTFERVLRARSRFDPRRGRQKAWIYAIAMNLLRDSARRSQTEERALERATVGGGDSLFPHDALDDRDELRRAMECLSAEERDVVALRFGGDLPVKEIATAIGESVTTTEGRLYRALRKLKSELS
ncbi:MAG TPA: sigma-70 family RNA polymerase sigma factor [Solirubrobacteraceae bacterium]|nr:sigma-70 family RNA polymerase sigma factor [Solirubrobacteraceae bacterium]